MIYLRSVIAGIVALILAGAFIYIGGFVAILMIVRPGGGGLDLPISHAHTKSLAFWLVAIVIFAGGFFWEFRRFSN